MKTSLLTGLVALAAAGYGVYDYTRPLAASPGAAQFGVAQELVKDPVDRAKTPDELAKQPPELAKEPASEAKTPDELAKVPVEEAKTPDDLGTILK